jgi:PPOX class probable F420-dependent enzyme
MNPVAPSDQRTIPGVPESHADLLDRTLSIVMTTEMADGRLQSTVVWFSRDGGDILVNTMREFQKARNLRARPRVTLLLMEPSGSQRWVEVRGTVTLHVAGAAAHLDSLALLYAGAQRYFGDVVPIELAETEHPLICRVHPLAVTVGPGYDAAVGRRSLPIPTPPTRKGCLDERPIPTSHRELLDRPVLAALSTRLLSGAQTHPTWFDLCGNDVLVNTTLERSKGRNLVRDPRATILVIDPDNSSRWIEIRGDVDLEKTGAIQHLDRLTRRYTSHPKYYGHIYPAERRNLETRVIVRIHPRHINCDAIHV